MGALDVAKCFVNIAHEQVTEVPEANERLHEDITHLKVQKLLYFAQAAHLAAHGTILFSDEIEAWKFGPVVPSVYTILKEYESKHIPNEIGEIRSEDLKSFLLLVWGTFGKYSASELVHLSHEVGPWKDFYEEGKNVKIPPDAIEAAFKEIFAFNNDTATAQATAT